MARGGYTPDEIRKMDELEIMFIFHHQEMAIYEQQNFLTSILGVVWDKNSLIESMAESKNKTKRALDKLFIPLALAINPDVMDFVQTQFGMGGKAGKVSNDGVIGNPFIAGGEYMPKAGETIMSMDNMNKEDFMSLLGKGERKKAGKSETGITG